MYGFVLLVITPTTALIITKRAAVTGGSLVDRLGNKCYTVVTPNTLLHGPLPFTFTARTLK